MAYNSKLNGINPTIIGIADSTHYLVGSTDANKNFVGLSPDQDIVTVNSLAEAKKLLRDHNIHGATLELQSAYDEMCGSASSGTLSQYIEF